MLTELTGTCGLRAASSGRYANRRLRTIQPMPASTALRATRSIPSSTTGSTISAKGRSEVWIWRKSCWICWMALPPAKTTSSSRPRRAASRRASAAWKSWKPLSSVMKEATILATLAAEALDGRVGGRLLQQLRRDRPAALEEAGHQRHRRAAVRRAHDGRGQLAAVHHPLAALGQAVHPGVTQRLPLSAPLGIRVGLQRAPRAHGHLVVLAPDHVDAHAGGQLAARPGRHRLLGALRGPVRVDQRELDSGSLDGLAHAGQPLADGGAVERALHIEDAAPRRQQGAELASLEPSDPDLVDAHRGHGHVGAPG